MDDNLKTHNKFAWIGLIILILILAIWLLVPRSANNVVEEKTLVEGVSGIQGVVTAFNAEINELTLKQSKPEQNPDGTYKLNEKTYKVTWNEATAFLAYKDSASLSGNNFTATDESSLGADKNIIVTPERTDKDGNVVASEIRILPDLTQ